MAKYHVLSEEGDVSFIADVDLTAKQYLFVGPASTANNVQVCTGTSLPGPFGILQNSPSLGQEARVRMFGFSKVWANQGACILQWGRYGYVASDGRFESVLVASPAAAGRWLSGASSAGASLYGEIQLYPGGIPGACPATAS